MITKINNLSNREKIFVYSGGVVLLSVVLLFGVFRPYQQGLNQIEARIISRQKQLEEVQLLQQEYFGLQKVLATAEKKLADTDQGFTLFSFIEDISTRNGVRKKLVSMRPQTPQIQGDYREESVEIKLERIDLGELVQFLYGIEMADAALQLKTVRIKPRFDNRAQLDTVLIISSLQRSS